MRSSHLAKLISDDWTGSRKSSHYTPRARPRKSEQVKQADQTLKGSAGLANSEQSTQKASTDMARCSAAPEDPQRHIHQQA